MELIPRMRELWGSGNVIASDGNYFLFGFVDGI
jgi:hypothetical protein